MPASEKCSAVRAGGLPPDPCPQRRPGKGRGCRAVWLPPGAWQAGGRGLALESGPMPGPDGWSRCLGPHAWPLCLTSKPGPLDRAAGPAGKRTADLARLPADPARRICALQGKGVASSAPAVRTLRPMEDTNMAQGVGFRRKKFFSKGVRTRAGNAVISGKAGLILEKRLTLMMSGSGREKSVQSTVRWTETCPQKTVRDRRPGCARPGGGPLRGGAAKARDCLQSY